MQHALVAMSMQQEHASLKVHDDLFERGLRLFEREVIRVRIEDCLPAFAAGGGRC